MKFLAPFFLYLLPLALTPLIIHLLSRFRLKKVDFSSIFFLIDLKKDRFNFYRLRDILLLILRTIFITLLILSLAHPHLITEKSSILKILPQKAKPIILILDDSYSMEYENNFEKGKKILKEIIKNLNKNSNITIFLTSKRKIVENEKPTNISDTLIDNLKVSYDRAYAQEILEGIKDFGGEVYLITDLQENSYSFLKNFENNFMIKIIDLGKERFENIGITDSRFLSEKEGEINFQIRLINYSQKELEIPINIRVGNFNTQNFLSLPPGSKEVQLTIPKIERNISAGKIFIEEKHLKKDNFYYFVYKPKTQFPILILYEDEEDVFYFKRLFSIIEDYQINYLPLREIKKISFSSYPLIFLINPSKIDQFLGWQLESCLKKGGKLILILGRVLKENRLSEIFETSKVWEGKGFLIIDEIEENHFIFQGFPKEVIREPKFYKMVNLQGKNLKVLARFSNKIPFLLKDTLNNLIIFASNFTENFTDMPTKIIFLPLVLRTIEYLGIKERNNFFVGETISLNFDLPKVKIITPFGNFLEETVLEKGIRVVKFYKTKEPGIYQVEDKTISVNVRDEEGNLKKLDLKERENLRIVKEEIKLEYELSWLFIFLAFFCFLIEIGFLLI